MIAFPIEKILPFLMPGARHYLSPRGFIFDCFVISIVGPGPLILKGLSRGSGEAFSGEVFTAEQASDWGFMKFNFMERLAAVVDSWPAQMVFGDLYGDEK